MGCFAGAYPSRDTQNAAVRAIPTTAGINVEAMPAFAAGGQTVTSFLPKSLPTLSLEELAATDSEDDSDNGTETTGTPSVGLMRSKSFLSSSFKR